MKRFSSINFRFDSDGYYDDDDYFDDYDGYVNLLHHEFCFDEFKGYGEEYEGPQGILTSYLPDGSSVTVHRNGEEKILPPGSNGKIYE